MKIKHIELIVHNVRSTHNVGSLLRTAEGLGVDKVHFTGYTPYPAYPADRRLPHLARKIDAQIHKTSLGAESMIVWDHIESIEQSIEYLKTGGFTIAALEQTAHSVALPTYTSPEKLAVIVGREVEGIEPEVIALCDLTIEIPMSGSKESFNVVQAAAMALYHLRYVG